MIAPSFMTPEFETARQAFRDACAKAGVTCSISVIWGKRDGDDVLVDSNAFISAGHEEIERLDIVSRKINEGLSLGNQTKHEQTQEEFLAALGKSGVRRGGSYE